MRRGARFAYFAHAVEDLFRGAALDCLAEDLAPHEVARAPRRLDLRRRLAAGLGGPAVEELDRGRVKAAEHLEDARRDGVPVAEGVGVDA